MINIDRFYKMKEYAPDLQIKEVSFGISKLYIINIQTVKVTIHLQFGNRFPGDTLQNAEKCGKTLRKRAFLY